MTQTQRTAAPLQYHRGLDYAVVMRPKDTTDTALIRIHGDTDEECDYWGSLIAAAPELLEAVQLWRQFFDDMPKGQFANISCDIGLMNDAFIKSSAAIAKATGKTGKKG